MKKPTLDDIGPPKFSQGNHGYITLRLPTFYLKKLQKEAKKKSRKPSPFAAEMLMLMLGAE